MAQRQVAHHHRPARWSIRFSVAKDQAPPGVEEVWVAEVLVEWTEDSSIIPTKCQ